MTKKVLFGFLLLFPFLMFSQEGNDSELSTHYLKNRTRINYMVLEMPGIGNSKDKTMAIGGLHYLIPINNFVYAGFHTNAALFGDQGGLFTLGIETGINLPITQNLFFDTNLNFGGGGGYRDVINKGGYLNPNIGLYYNFKNISLGLQYSHFNFYSGHVKDNSLSLFIEIPTNVLVSKYSNSRKTYSINNLLDKKNNKNSFSIKFDQYLPFGKTRKDREENSELLRNTLYLLGFEYQRYYNERGFLFIHSDAVYSGLVAGFMDIFGGFGYEPIQTKHFNIFTKLGIGAAGGRVRAEGGATIYPSLGMDYHISKHFSIFTHLGYTKALDGYFEAYTLGGGLKYNTLPNKKEKTEPKNIITNGIRLSIQHQSYFNLPRIIRTPLNRLDLLALQVNYNITNSLYAIFQASFAYGSYYEGPRYTIIDGIKNDNTFGAGGYADGMLGIGIYSPIFANGKLQAFADILGGAGGGAGIDTGGGLFAKVRIGGYYHINSYLSIIASGGKVIAPFGGVNSNNVNIGVSVNFSTLSTVFK